jgi:capsular exopolysaccharide synthesis family protein
MELDLRKPKLSKLLNIKREPGISNFLMNNVHIDDIIKPTEFENLFLVPAGPIPPNPTELIEKQEFSDLMEMLKSRFDYVIIDTAPIGPVTDAQLLSKHVNTTIFMVRHNHTPNVFIRMIDGFYADKKFKNMCIDYFRNKRHYKIGKEWDALIPWHHRN